MDILYTQRHALHDPRGVQMRNSLFIPDETPERAEVIRSALEHAGLGAVLPPDDLGDEPILAVHTPEMVAFLRTGYARQMDEFGLQGALLPEVSAIRPVRHASTHPVALAGIFCHGPDSPLLPGTWEAAYWSAQCALSAADRLLNGPRAAYALCRPPGHHALHDAYGGFCYLNNAAIAARYLQNAGGRRKIAILDVDYHHGNGTQEIFYHDPSVLTCSLHASPDDDYPYFWGGADETGAGVGEGFNCNWPLPPACSPDDYFQALGEALDNIADYTPEALVVSLGLDILSTDPLGGFDISVENAGQIGATVASLDLPTLIVQEGGYHLETLGAGAVAFLQNFSL